MGGMDVCERGRTQKPFVPASCRHTHESFKEDRAADAKRRARIKKIEDEISALETEDERLNTELSDPQVTANFALLTEKCNRLEEIKNLLESLYSEYETLI